jgi:hypothetical protein
MNKRKREREREREKICCDSANCLRRAAEIENKRIIKLKKITLRE